MSWMSWHSSGHEPRLLPGLKDRAGPVPPAGTGPSGPCWRLATDVAIDPTGTLAQLVTLAWTEGHIEGYDRAARERPGPATTEP